MSRDLRNLRLRVSNEAKSTPTASTIHHVRLDRKWQVGPKYDSSGPYRELSSANVANKIMHPSIKHAAVRHLNATKDQQRPTGPPPARPWTVCAESTCTGSTSRDFGRIFSEKYQFKFDYFLSKFS